MLTGPAPCAGGSPPGGQSRDILVCAGFFVEATHVPGIMGPARESGGDFTFTFHFHAMEKEMATHSSVLAWRIPGTAEQQLKLKFSHSVMSDSL